MMREEKTWRIRCEYPIGSKSTWVTEGSHLIIWTTIDLIVARDKLAHMRKNHSEAKYTLVSFRTKIRSQTPHFTLGDDVMVRGKVSGHFNPSNGMISVSFLTYERSLTSQIGIDASVVKLVKK